MTGWDIVSIVVLLAIAGLFARVQLAGRFDTLRGRRDTPSPQSLQESGGYQARRPSRSGLERGPANGPPVGTGRSSRRERASLPASLPRRPQGIRDEARRQLRSPGSAKMAFVMHEVLDTPVGLRDDDAVPGERS